MKDVAVSKQDRLTEDTAKQIRENIEGRASVCGPSEKPAPKPAEKPAAVASAEKS